MAKLPFRGIAQIVTSKEPLTLPTPASVAAPRQRVQAEVQPGLRPIGFDAVELGSASPRARLTRWWSAIKRLVLSLSDKADR